VRLRSACAALAQLVGRLFDARWKDVRSLGVAAVPAVPDGDLVCPITVGIEGRDVVLVARSEGLGIFLEPCVARSLGLSLIAASEEVCVR
jgi:hypothetical protein